MNQDELYRQWIERRRSVCPPDGFGRRVMKAVEDRRLTAIPRWASLGGAWIGRVAVCLAAMAIGLMPYVFAAFLAKLIPF